MGWSVRREKPGGWLGRCTLRAVWNVQPGSPREAGTLRLLGSKPCMAPHLNGRKIQSPTKAHSVFPLRHAPPHLSGICSRSGHPGQGSSKPTRDTPILGPLHWLFLLPGTFFPQISPWLSVSQSPYLKFIFTPPAFWPSRFHLPCSNFFPIIIYHLLTCRRIYLFVILCLLSIRA